MLDGDTAGRAATEVDRAEGYRKSWILRPIHLKSGVQPDQLSPREINDMLSGHLRLERGLER